MLSEAKTTRFLQKLLRNERDLGLQFAPLGSADMLADELLRASAWYCFFDGRELPHSSTEFDARIAQHRRRGLLRFETLLGHAKAILAARFVAVRALSDAKSPAYVDAVRDMNAQLTRLVPSDFLDRLPLRHLAEVPRYLEAISHRLDGLQGRLQKDAQSQAEIAAFEATPRPYCREARGACRSRRRALSDRGISGRSVCATAAYERQGVGETHRVGAWFRWKRKPACVEFERVGHAISSRLDRIRRWGNSMLKRWMIAGLLTGLTFSAFAETETTTAVESTAGHVSDPWQGMNRRVFAFNETMDRWVLKPVAKGYTKVTPRLFRRGISNFFTNLSYPLVIVNQFLQGKFATAQATRGVSS